VSFHSRNLALSSGHTRALQLPQTYPLYSWGPPHSNTSSVDRQSRGNFGRLGQQFMDEWHQQFILPYNGKHCDDSFSEHIMYGGQAYGQEGENR
jgi:hypothetical protein